MGKIAPDFSKWPLHLESMGPFNNVEIGSYVSV